MITAEVEELRDRFGLPGMKVLQFAFDGNADNPYVPYRRGEHSVIYTETHDNDTTEGWWSTLDEETSDRVRSHLVDPDEAMPQAFVRLAPSSTARLAVVRAQDLLGLGSEGRMNTPGTAEGNWGWQAAVSIFDGDLAARFHALVTAADRLTGTPASLPPRARVRSYMPRRDVPGRRELHAAGAARSARGCAEFRR